MTTAVNVFLVGFAVFFIGILSYSAYLSKKPEVPEKPKDAPF